MRHNAWDAVNGTAAVGFLASYMAGIGIADVAAFLAAVYSLILIIEKVGPRIKRWAAGRKR